MKALSTNYMGLQLKNPIIASSSGLTASLDDIMAIEKAGAGAVVLKSLFEEEIIAEMDRNFSRMHSENYLYPETMEFYENDDQDDRLTSYLKLISDCKKQVKIPVIASINCTTPYNWPYFAKTLQDAGADALELNVFLLPMNTQNSCADNENALFEIVKNTLAEVSIPVSVKMSYYFSNLASVIERLSKTGVKGIVLFNRFFSPDIDTDTLEVVPSHIYSTAEEAKMPLQWIGLSYNRVDCHLSASTGVQNSNTLIKMILAGAQTVQLSTVLYRKGFDQITIMLNELESWMKEKGFTTTDSIRGILSQAQLNNPAGYQRVQFMKYFANK